MDWLIYPLSDQTAAEHLHVTAGYTQTNMHSEWISKTKDVLSRSEFGNMEYHARIYKRHAYNNEDI